VLAERLKLVVVEFEVTDVTISLASKIEHLATIIPEGHANTRLRIKVGEVTAHRLGRVARVP
jgi:hypothetical protein